METKILTAIFAVALIAAGGFGSAAANSEDLEGFDTPCERAFILADKVDSQIASADRALEAGQITAHQHYFAVKDIYRTAVDEYNDYKEMYYLISNNEYKLTGNGEDVCHGSFEVENVAFRVGNSSFSLGAGTFSYECNGNITVELAQMTVTATATAFDEMAQTATLTDILIHYAYGAVQHIPGIYQVAW